MSITAQQITKVALFTAIITICGPLTIPIGVVPLSLCSLAVMITACSVGFIGSSVATATYLLLGGIGLPVFSGFSGGFGVLVGPTGGYLLGYLIMAIITSIISRKKRLLFYAVACAMGTLALYSCGTAWFVAQTGTDFLSALALTVLPFLPFDAVKIIVASVVGDRLNKIIKKENKNG
ncbi:MAG: biotin transporter BioY [Clostridia bacterium]|nr:biotin transporter BioY [Clostridia bacterium]